jgi:uncharacterized protein (TIGR00661 family)
MWYMAKIFYSLAGEGRGHAARARTLVELLKRQHEIWLFAPDQAYEFLRPLYGRDTDHPQIHLLRIPGLRFHYTGQRLDLWTSIFAGITYAWRDLPRLVSAFKRRIQAVQPDLILCDFEPSLPRAAAAARSPWLAIDHQHMLLTYNLSTLPWTLRLHAWLMGWAVQWYYGWRKRKVVTSSFYRPPLKRGWTNVSQVGPLIRREVAEATPQWGEHFVSYLRSQTPQSVLDALATSTRPVKVYGLGTRPGWGPLSFCEIDSQRFVDDLASCAGVICAAGNQLLGEALSLGKPILALPERRHYEQLINAHFLQQSQAGTWTTLEQFQAADLAAFEAQLADYQHAASLARGADHGTAETIAIIEAELQRSLHARGVLVESTAASTSL